MPKKPLGIMGLHEVLGREYGIEEPYRGPCKNDSLLSPGLHYRSPVVSHIKTPSLLTHLLYSWILVDSLWYTKHSTGLSRPYLIQRHPTHLKNVFLGYKEYI